jgi:hypothetical protein
MSFDLELRPAPARLRAGRRTSFPFTSLTANGNWRSHCEEAKTRRAQLLIHSNPLIAAMDTFLQRLSVHGDSASTAGTGS